MVVALRAKPWNPHPTLRGPCGNPMSSPYADLILETQGYALNPKLQTINPKPRKTALDPKPHALNPQLDETLKVQDGTMWQL